MPDPWRSIDAWAARDTVFIPLLVGSAAAFYLTPWPAVYGVCLLTLAALSFLRLRPALALVPGFAPFVMEPKHIGHLMFAPTELLLGLDAGIALILVVLHRPPLPRWDRLLKSPFLLPACVFVFAVTLSTLDAPDRHLALHAYRERVADPLIYFGLLILFLRTRADWYWILAGAVTGGMVAGAIGLGQFALQRDLSTVTGTGIKRVQSLYGSPDNLGLLFDRVVPIWFVIAMTVRRSSRRRLLLWAVGVFLIPPLVLTYSVGAWIAIAVVCAGVVALMRPWGKWVVLAALVLAAAGVGVKHQSVQRAFQAGHSNSTQARIDVWRSSLQMIRDRPILGIGPDNFQRLYAPTLAQDRFSPCPPGLGYLQPGAGSEPCLSHPHDEFLDFWLSAGFMGLISYFWLLVVFWQQALRVWRRGAVDQSRILAPAVMAGMLASMIHGLIDNSYFLADLSLFFWLFCAAISWLSNETAISQAAIGVQSYMSGHGATSESANQGVGR